MKKLIGIASGIAGVALTIGIVFAAPGDPVPPGSITPPGPLGDGCGGIGVAYDGATIWYNCALETKLRKTNLAGADLGFIDTVEGVTPIHVDAIAWDPNEGKIWGGALVDTDGVVGNDTCRIYSIDPVTGAATTRFSYVDVHGGCSYFFYDGLTVDSVTDTVWASPDIHSHIHHYMKDGTEIAADLIDFVALTPDGEPDVNSGLAIGIDGTLYAGTNGFAKIVRIDTPGAGATFGGVFATVSGRDEDLECGPKTEGKETILSRDLFLPGRIDILEAPEGTCQSPVEPVDERRMTGGGSVFTANPVRVTHGFELHCDVNNLPNRLEVNWDKGNKFHLENLTSAVCVDDPNLDEEQPVAGFDTYEGQGTGRYNGVSGATAKWKFTDDGEPGTSDTVWLEIKDASNVVVQVTGLLDRGNHQAHPN